MKALALDISTYIGWALGDGTPAKTSFGTMSLHTSSYDYAAMSQTFCFWLADQIVTEHPKLIAVERGFFRGKSSYFLSGLIWDAHRTAFIHEIPRVEYPPKKLKMAVTGNGSASKSMMMEWAKRQGFDAKTDHESDALALLRVALQEKEEACVIADSDNI